MIDPMGKAILFLSAAFFLSGEVFRSRHYGRTAALSLLVQPYDEDEDDDFFVLFQVMEHRWNEIDRVKQK
jgi:hypothetical protein